MLQFLAFNEPLKFMNKKVKLPKGTLPESVLFRTSNTINKGASASFIGIEPKRRLKLKSNLSKVPKFPSAAGIAPVSWLY